MKEMKKMNLIIFVIRKNLFYCNNINLITQKIGSKNFSNRINLEK